MKPGLIIAGFALMTVLALIGWTRKPTAEPARFDNPAATTPAMAEPAPAPPEVVAPGIVQVAGHRDRLMARRAEPARRVGVRKRPISHSVAIVVASAGTGAAIGVLAGGGKGAGIGALVAGAGGFIYDRLTHAKKTVE